MKAQLDGEPAYYLLASEQKFPQGAACELDRHDGVSSKIYVMKSEPAGLTTCTPVPRF